MTELVEYVCAVCQKAFCEEVDTERWNEQKRREELKRNFGDVPVSQCDRVCSDCYEKVMRWAKLSHMGGN